MHHVIRLLLIGLVFVQGCGVPPGIPADPTSPVTTVYQIRAGAHYADHQGLNYTAKTSLSFSVTFDSTAIYTSRTPENQHDINKLYGFSDCGAQHNTASARFGWNWRDDSLRIYAYCYRNGERISEELGTAELNQPTEYRLSIVGGNYVFTFKGKETSIARSCTTVESDRRYRLYPYFGGDETAPHTITISITEK
ncbi:hypothetical protein GCM10027299_54600 [Larkinella ripae]